MILRVLQKLIRPRSGSEDSRRREFVLNVILLGSIVLSAVATMDNFIDWLRLGADYRGVPPGRILVFTLIFVSLYLASRARFYIQASYVLVGLYCAGALYTVYTWGVGNPHGLLVLGLVIFMSGILISARFAFVLALFVSLVLLTFNYLQINSITPPNVYWRHEAFGMDDTIIVVAIFGVMTAISWLSNREIEKSLVRARRSEVALKKERDNLEVKVEERTSELKQAQLEKVMHLYRLADFGAAISVTR